MLKQIILSGADARSALLRGVDVLANVVKVTLGPEGRLVVISRRGLQQSPLATKDGVTCANFVEPADSAEQMGSDLAREASQKTVEACGDGTTSCAVLTQAMAHAGIAALSQSCSPISLVTGMKQAVLDITSTVMKHSIPATEAMLAQVATISANGDADIGKLVSEAVAAVGKDGIMAAVESKSLDTYLEVESGMSFPQGMLSPYFINDTSHPICSFSNALILIYEGKLGSSKSLIPLLKLARGLNQQLLLIAGDYEPEVLSLLVKNKLEGHISACAIRAPGYGPRRADILRDLAIMTGGKAITEDTGMKIENITEDYLGKVSRILVTENRTTITGGQGDETAVSQRVATLRQQIIEAEPGNKAFLEQRLSGLTGGVALIKVGGTTETEMREKKDRIEDALYATRAAAEEGIVQGGGLALFLASTGAFPALTRPPGEITGYTVVRDACQAPLRQIATNASESADAVVDHISKLEPGIGYNAASGKYEDMLAAGVIDPTRVVLEALKNAASVCYVILRTEALIFNVNVPEKEAK